MKIFARTFNSKDNDLLVFETERKEGATEIRGTGCRLASAIAFFLASEFH